jgi:hypothetical protein
MKERPILFSGPMVNAIRNDRKTQTRRVVKPQPYLAGEARLTADYGVGFTSGPVYGVGPKYGIPGDRLWVRETFASLNDPSNPELPAHVLYRSDSDSKPAKWTPAIFMPRWASRITLEVTGVRVERLQDIGEGDSVAEGVVAPRCPKCNYTLFDCRFQMDHGLCGPAYPGSAIPVYGTLWSSINGPGSWEANPFVWVIEFKRI